MEIVFGLMYLVLVKVSAGRYNVNRFYNTILKRYIQPDPLYSDMIAKGKAKRFHFADPSLLHPYMYVNNNGVNKVDPLGLVDIFVFFEFDFVPFLGAEGALGLVIDTDHPFESGIFRTASLAGGLNIGIGWGGGLCTKDIEGFSENFDINFPPFIFSGASVTLGVGSDKGFTVAGSKGLGFGASSGASYTETILTVEDIINFFK